MIRGRLELRGDVGPRKPNHRNDVIFLQMVLSRLKEPGSTKYYDGQISGRFNQKLQTAIVKFQNQNRLQCNGIVGRRSRCLTLISDLVVKSLPQKTKAASLTFNGKEICWVGPPHNGKCWPAVSGKKGYQTKEYQAKKDTGPIPEGKWRVRQDQHQRYDIPAQIRHWIAVALGGATWPGGTSSWGSNRIWIKPLPGTKVFGRSGFSIHGGRFPGSAGCIDLTNKMPDFTEAFISHGFDMDLKVKY